MNYRTYLRKVPVQTTLAFFNGASEAWRVSYGCCDLLKVRHFVRAAPTLNAHIKPIHVGECVSAKGPKDTFDGSAQDNSPREVDINEGLVDGRVEGRTGVHVRK